MTNRHRYIDRFDDDPALPMQDPQRVRKPQDVAERLNVPVAASTLEVADVGGAVDGSEIHDISAHMQVPAGISRMQDKRFGRAAQKRLNDIASEPHVLRFLVHDGAAIEVNLACRCASNLEPGLLQHPESREQNSLHLLRGQYLQRRPRVGQPRQRRKRGTGVSGRTAPFASTR